MGSIAMLMINMFSPKSKHLPCIFFNFGQTNLSSSFYRKAIQQISIKNQITRNYSVQISGLEPPDVSHLAETARISLTPNEVQEFGPKINEVINWFGQLEDVDLENIEPAIRADTEADNTRDDLPETFTNRESIISALPSYEEPYVKVPKVLNKEE